MSLVIPLEFTDKHLNRIIDISQKGAQYDEAGNTVRPMSQKGLSNKMIEAVTDPWRHKKTYRNLEIFRFENTLVVLCQITLEDKPHLFWQGAIDLKTGRLTEVPPGKRLIVTK